MQRNLFVGLTLVFVFQMGCEESKRGNEHAPVMNAIEKPRQREEANHPEWQTPADFARILLPYAGGLTARRETAVAMAWAGLVAEAEMLANAIDDEFEKTKTLHKIVLALIDAGFLEEAESLITRIDDSCCDGLCKAKSLSTLAARFAADGEIDSSDRLIAPIVEIVKNSKREAPKSYQWLKANLRDAKTADEASEVSQIYEAEKFKQEARCATALTLARLLKISQAVDVAETIADRDSRGTVLGEIALIEAKQGDFNGALHRLQFIEDTNAKVTALIGVSRELVNSGDNSRAKEILNQAKQFSHAIKEDHVKGRLLTEIAITLIEVEKKKLTLENIREAINVAVTSTGEGYLVEFPPEKLKFYQDLLGDEFPKDFQTQFDELNRDMAA